MTSVKLIAKTTGKGIAAGIGTAGASNQLFSEYTGFDPVAQAGRVGRGEISRETWRKDFESACKNQFKNKPK